MAEEGLITELGFVAISCNDFRQERSFCDFNSLLIFQTAVLQNVQGNLEFVFFPSPFASAAFTSESVGGFIQPGLAIRFKAVFKGATVSKIEVYIDIKELVSSFTGVVVLQLSS